MESAENHSEESKDSITCVELYQQVNADGTAKSSHLVYPNNATEDEIREHVAGHYGGNPADVELSRAKSSTGAKTFGFSNWSGSSWEPAGPKPNWVEPEHSELN